MGDATQPSPGRDSDSFAATEVGTMLDGGEGGRGRGRAFELDEDDLSRLGRFAILRRVGAGAMGVVFAAYDEQLDRKVAIKLLHRRDVPERLLREARGLAQLSHPNVVQIYEIGEHEGAAFLAMEFVDGDTLSAWLGAREQARWQVRMVPLLEAGRGLAAAHEKGLVHRDFKPDNVMVGGDGRVRVMDFGLVRHEHEAGAPERGDGDAGRVESREAKAVERGLTRTGALMGTPAYMAPEQHEGRPADARSDQFAFCVALWEGLYGERPYGGSNLAELFLAVSSGERREPAGGVEVPGWVRAVVERGLAPKPEDRWPSMAELLAALTRDRSHKRRWSAAALVGVAVVIGTIAGVRSQAQLERERAIEACASEAALIAESWNPQLGAEVEASLKATGLDAAPELWTRVDEGLGAYATRWAAIHEQACLDADDPAKGPGVSATHACLREARIALDASVSLLTEADRMVAARAAGLVVELPRLERCIDAAALALRPPIPSGVEAEFEQLLRKLAGAELEAYAGRYAASLAIAEALLVEAEALAWPPFVAEVTLFIGGQHLRLGELEASERELRRAFSLAVEAGADEIALRAATKLVRVVGYDLSRPAEGLVWADFGEALVERLGLAHEIEHAMLLNEIATVRGEQEQLDAAALGYAEAIAVAEARLGREDLIAAAFRYNLATVQLLVDEPDAARRNLERTLAIRETALGPKHPVVAESLSTLANLLDGLGQVEDARKLATQALVIREAAFEPNSQSIGSSLAMLGAIESGAGEWEQATASFERSLVIYREVYGAVHPRVAMVLGNLGVTALNAGDPERGTTYFEQAVAATKPASKEYVIALRRLAVIYGSYGRDAEAERELDRALAAAEEIYGPHHTMTAAVVRSIGVFALEHGLYTRALAMLERAEAIYLAEGDEDEIGVTSFYLGRAELELGHPAEAVVFLTRAVEHEDTAHPETHFYLAKALWAAGERGAAREAGREALEIEPEGYYAPEISAWLDQH